MTTLDFNRFTSIGGTDTDARTIFAIPKKDRSAISSLLTKMDSTPSSEQAKNELLKYPIEFGYVIPSVGFDESWLYGIQVGKEELLELAIRVGRKVKHGNSDLIHGSDSPSLSLLTGIGQCFERASIIAAVYRLNGISARIVGRDDFFDQGGGHWWVEAYINNEWKPFDSTFNEPLIDQLFCQVDLRQVSNISLPRFLADSLQQQTARGVGVSQIFSSVQIDKIERRVVAAETDLL